MKTKQIFKFLTLAIALLSASMAGATGDFPKEIKKTLSANKDVHFIFDVNFADVTITTWDQTNVEIVVSIQMEVKNQERANELYDKIKVDIGGAGAEVFLKVEMDNITTKNNENWSMDVQVRMPTGGSIQGSSDFGDLSIPEFAGKVDAKVSYGAFMAASLSGKENEIDVNFGDVEVGTWSGGGVRCEYGVIEMGKVNGNLNVEISFGDVKLGSIQSACKSLIVQIEYGNLEAVCDPAFGASFDATASYGSIYFPNKATFTEKTKEGMTEKMVGSFGSGNSKMRILASFGDIEIK
ncbi:MAG: DUF4097 family beta strand repeat-containing protein [Flavobacteriales bacterium]|nr:DUF4097 family beta strand repeat-containing protein [Flavobacteriales bacterium]